MRAGKLRQQIVIQQSTPAPNAKGEPIDSWGTFATLRASVEPVSGREFFAAQQVAADVNFVITIRHYPGVTPKMRVSWDGRLFDIRNVLNLEERDRQMRLMCRELN